MTTIKVEEATEPDDLGLGDAPVVPVFVDSSGRRSRRIRRVGWVVSAVCLAYIGLIAVSMSDTQHRPADVRPARRAERRGVPGPRRRPARRPGGPAARLGAPTRTSRTAATGPRTTTMLAAMGGHGTKKVGSRTAQTAPPTSRATAKAPTPAPPRATRPQAPTSTMALGSTAP